MVSLTIKAKCVPTATMSCLTAKVVRSKMKQCKVMVKNDTTFIVAHNEVIGRFKVNGFKYHRFVNTPGIIKEVNQIIKLLEQGK